jgi:hypothetical protein
VALKSTQSYMHVYIEESEWVSIDLNHDYEASFCVIEMKVGENIDYLYLFVLT